ncbi:MAG: DUF3575 domain-containing protein [Bacteroidia bacterium]|nr:DUF3575 domain-containing protein [Bacteroidia bacterium]
MKRLALLFCILLGIGTITQAQTVPDSVRYFRINKTQRDTLPDLSNEINIKVNLLHLPFGAGVPSIHAEFKKTKHLSINLSIFYISVFDVFTLTNSRSFGSNVVGRYYFGKLKPVSGFYLGLGASAFMVNRDANATKSNSIYLGPRAELGYKISPQRWVFDFGLGTNYYFEGGFPTMMIGVGYKIRK